MFLAFLMFFGNNWCSFFQNSQRRYAYRYDRYSTSTLSLTFPLIIRSSYAYSFLSIQIWPLVSCTNMPDVLSDGSFRLNLEYSVVPSFILWSFIVRSMDDWQRAREKLFIRLDLPLPEGPKIKRSMFSGTFAN